MRQLIEAFYLNFHRAIGVMFLTAATIRGAFRGTADDRRILTIRCKTQVLTCPFIWALQSHTRLYD